MTPTTHIITHRIPLTRWKSCQLCLRPLSWEYEELVDAAGVTIYECLCGGCAGIQMVARSSQPFSEALKGA